MGFEEVKAATLKNENQKVTDLLSDTSESVEFEFIQDDCSLTISTPNFSYCYDKLKGVFTEMVYRNHSLLECPMEFNIWRAPTDNDNNIKKEWKKAQYDRIVTRAYETKTFVNQDKVRVETTLSVSAVYTQKILDIKAYWTVYANGVIDVELDVKKNLKFPFLPRFGLRMFLPKSMTKVTYCGLGPVESYVDKKWASYHGLFHTDVKAMHEDYIRPQENGSHYDCDYITVSDERISLTAAGAETFAFNVSVYTQEELSRKAHNYQLEESPYTVLCVDYRQSGIGSNSCGPQLAEKYQLNEEKFCFRIRLKPECIIHV